MDEKVLQMYRACVRFDEGTLYQSDQYKTISTEENRLRDVIVDTYGLQIVPLLEEYTAAIYDEMELEAQHYFEQGTKAV